MWDRAKILVVDDMPANLEVIIETLSCAGYTLATAISGERALKRLKTYVPDLILLDVQMPGIDGFETCRRIKANPNTSDIPIIFITALSDTESIVKGFSLGAVDYISKPFQESELLARVKTHLKLQFLNQSLEQQIAERTLELQTALEKLQHSQLQIVQNEKMVSLGNLVAGVAHEINNPVNFIHANLSHLHEYTQELLELTNFCQQNSPELVAQTQADETDLEFIQEDLPKILESMNVGTQRIRQIVLSLRNFSRMDEAEYKAVNLHEGIDSTLLILQHRLKSKSKMPAIQVIKDYENLPLVECYAGQINQVFMNLLTNAIDALEEANSQRTIQQRHQQPNQITIKTSVLPSGWVEIAIADNGVGIPEDIQVNIFEPFFTTKPVGKGTGLGMSISHQIIVEKHGGKLMCLSTPGKGSEFMIHLPCKR